MDFEGLHADVDMILSKHFTRGRGGRKIDKVVVHYNAGNLSVAGCYGVWQTRQASAHYQVEESGRIGQLVHDSDTAWHCGNFEQNQRSIGIEHANRPDGTISEACLDAGAHLVAAVCKAYGLGRPEWLKNVFPHRYFASTSCPGQIYGSQKDAYISRAQRWYDAMTGAGEEPSAAGTGFGGTYRCTIDGLNIRCAPSTSAEIDRGATYDTGETVVLDDWYEIADGYVWGRYTTLSSATRYVAVGRATGKPEADDYLVKVDGTPYVVRVISDDLNVRTGPGTDNAVAAVVHRGEAYTIVEEADGAGASKWGRLKSGAGWVALDHTERV